MVEPNPSPAWSPGPRLARGLLAVYWPALAVATHWPRLDITGGRNQLLHGAVQVDKICHALGFALLAWLLLAARPAGRGASRAVTGLLATLIAAAYAGVDEWTQGPFGRDVGLSDVVASLIGVFGASLLWLTPAHAEAVGSRGWRIVLARLSWIVVAPLATALATLRGIHTVAPLRVMIEFITNPALGRDKFAHFILAWALTWLLAAAAPAGRRRPRLGALLTILLMAASAPVIELVQRQTGRGFELADIEAHQRGLLVAMVGWWVWMIVWSWGAKPAAGAPGASDASGPAALGGSRDEEASAAASPAAAAEGGVARAGFVGHAIVVGLMTFASRITGLVRDSVLAAVFGLGSAADAFFIGFLVPNLFRRLFGEGALSAAFIPHYTDLLRRDPGAARRFATLCLTALTLLLTVVTLLGELLLLAMLARDGWTDHARLAMELTMVMLPYMPLICLVAVIGGVLQVHGKFGAPAAAPVLLNLAMIAGAAWVLWEPAGGGARRTAFVIAWSVVVAGVLQLAWQVAAMLRVTSFATGAAGTGDAFRGMMRMMLPMVLGLAIFQINAFTDSLIAFVLAAREGGAAHGTILGWTFAYPMDAGAVAALQWAQRLYQFPLGVFGIAVATAIFPALASAAPALGVGGAGDPAKPRAATGVEPFARILRQGLRLTVFIGLPASAGLILLRVPLARVVFERGEFTLEDARRVATILAGYSASIWAYSMTHVLTRAFYAMKDSKTPLKVSLVMVAFNLGLNFTLIWPLGAAGLAWATATSAAIQSAVLLVLLGRRVPSLVDGYVLRGWGRTAILTAVMVAALLPFVLFLDLETPGFTHTAAVLMGLVFLGMAIVLIGAWITGAEELAVLRRRGR